MTAEQLRSIGLVAAGILAINLMLFTLLIILAYRRVRHLHIPPDADFTQTLLHVPLLLVLAIDLLDLTLDIFSVPIVWIILDRMNLRALRNVSVIEAAIPFTQPIPTLTLAWFGVRLLRREKT
ncbi:MAG: hypothetical protein KC418_09410 [Anaerolineales bacterium]|nr:hypothetical protein [Anaerolineales bacterium]MCB8952488.1 hypothetical protein [Ardenticatenales bacterium]